MNAVNLLIFNATLQLFVSSILGFLMLIPMQPWGRGFFSKIKNPADIRSVHLDWLMLAFMQFGAAFGLSRIPVQKELFIASLLILGGWMNAFPYLVRGIWGINAFSLSGDAKQLVCAGLGLLSVSALLLAFFLLLFNWYNPVLISLQK